MNRLTVSAKSGLKYLAMLAATIVGGVASNASAAPDYTPGVWKNLTPPGVVMTKDNHIFCQGVTVDPVHPSTIYLCVCGYDISKAGLFTLSASEKQPAFISPEKDGKNWTAFEGGTQKFDSEPFEMRVAPANHVIYSANWGDGLWAVKVDPTKQAQPAPKAK